LSLIVSYLHVDSNIIGIIKIPNDMGENLRDFDSDKKLDRN